MKATYLLINFLTVLFPVILSFDKRVRFYKNWKYIFPGLLISGLFFLLWDHLFPVFGVWSFNPDYIIGYYILDLPLEEILFFITVPFACIFIYYDRVYTFITFGLLAAVLLFAGFIVKNKYLSRFYLAYLVSLIPFYIVNGILTSIPVVIYNDQENMAFRIGSIPFEDHFYSMSMLMINILLFEYFLKRGEATV